MTSSRWVHAGCLLLAIAAARPAAAGEAAPTTATTTRPAGATQSRRDELIERVARYYLDLYGKYLKTSDPLARTMVVISLADLDDPRSTEMILGVMRTDRAPIVRIYAWEAIHARLGRLTESQRDQWVRCGYEFAEKNWLFGDLRIGLVGVMDLGGPTDLNKRLFLGLFEHTNSLNPGDMRTLDAMGKLLARWRSPALIKPLIRVMDQPNAAWRAEYVLRPLLDDPDRVTSAVKIIWRLGSERTWPRVQKQWAKWFTAADLPEAAPAAGPYEGGSALMPAGEKITDPSDPKWRKDLELGRFSLRQLDVGFVIDSTGSMGACIRWIQRDVVRIMRGFQLISREPRIGVTLYRDHGDEYLVHPIPLSNRANVLARALKGARARGGDDIPEAVYEGIYALALTNRWSPGARARKIVILMGDAPPHEKDLERIDKLVALGVSKGFGFYAVKIRSHYRNRRKRPNYDPQLATFDRIAAAGGGKSFWVDFHALRRRRRRRGYALPRPKDAPDRVMFRQVLKAAIAKGYEDRVNWFVNVLEQYVERPYREVRRPIHPPRPKRPSRPSKPKPDPQDR